MDARRAAHQLKPQRLGGTVPWAKKLLLEPRCTERLPKTVWRHCGMQSFFVCEFFCPMFQCPNHGKLAQSAILLEFCGQRVSHGSDGCGLWEFGSGGWKLALALLRSKTTQK
jgi:hypothetical protein